MRGACIITAGSRRGIDFDLLRRKETGGTPFQRSVWDALQEIPYGETVSYSQIAEMLGDKNKVRAVARACASNRVAVVIPCHRVVGKGGGLTGYRWGVERKERLLKAEKAGR